MKEDIAQHQTVNVEITCAYLHTVYLPEVYIRLFWVNGSVFILSPSGWVVVCPPTFHQGEQQCAHPFPMRMSECAHPLSTQVNGSVLTLSPWGWSAVCSSSLHLVIVLVLYSEGMFTPYPIVLDISLDCFNWYQSGFKTNNSLNTTKISHTAKQLCHLKISVTEVSL